MNLVTTYMTKNGLYDPKCSMHVRGLMFHSLGMPVDSPEEMYTRWNKPEYRKASIHGFVGADEVLIVEPCMEKPRTAMRAWYSASGVNGRADNDHLGFEMCEPSCIKYIRRATFVCSDVPAAVAFVWKSTRNMAELFAKLCRFHGLDPLEDGVILSHAEAYKRELASNHGDPSHLWKQLGMDYDMDQFRADVAWLMKEEEEIMTYDQWKEYMERYRKELGEQKAASWAVPYIEKCIDAGVMSEVNGTIERPTDFLPRQEAAVMVANAIKDRDVPIIFSTGVPMCKGYMEPIIKEIHSTLQREVRLQGD